MQREGACYLCGGKSTHRITWREAPDEPESGANYCAEHASEEVKYLQGKGATDIEMTELPDESEAAGPEAMP